MSNINSLHIQVTSKKLGGLGNKGVRAKWRERPLRFWSNDILTGSQKTRRFVRFDSLTSGSDGSMAVQPHNGPFHPTGPEKPLVDISISWTGWYSPVFKTLGVTWVLISIVFLMTHLESWISEEYFTLTIEDLLALLLLSFCKVSFFTRSTWKLRD